VNERLDGIGTISGQTLRELEVAPIFRRLRIWAHVCVIIGTFVWGFGDCLLEGGCAS
jgi:hypothetical protein